MGLGLWGAGAAGAGGGVGAGAAVWAAVWAAGLLGCWAAGLLGCWAAGLLGCWALSWGNGFGGFLSGVVGGGSVVGICGVWKGFEGFVVVASAFFLELFGSSVFPLFRTLEVSFGRCAWRSRKPI